MNLTLLSEILEKMYNTLGNKYLTKNFITEPFDFKVKVIYDRDDEYYDYIIQVYSIPDIPKSFNYKPEVRELENKWADAIDLSVLSNEFKKYVEYVDPSSKRIYGLKFMNRENTN